MLKIKNNIDLIELEIFNFYDMGNCYQKYLEFGVQLYVDKQTRIITRNAPYDARYMPNKDEISDLIKADIVEDVAEEITYAYGVNLEEDIIIIEKQQKRIAELEQELAEKTAKLEFANKEIERLKASNCYIHDLHNNLYREYQKKNDELYKNQKQLDQANERLKGAIVPKFKVGQKIWYIDRYGIQKDTIISFTYFSIQNEILYKMSDEIIDYREEYIFATEQEAQAKLKEIQGNG